MALRRREEPEPFAVGALAIDYRQRRVTLGGAPLELTATEYELLRVLSLNAGRVVSFDTLLRRVWAKREHVAVGVLRIFGRNLRLKLGDSADSPAYIFNQCGVGYRMAAPSGSRQRPRRVLRRAAGSGRRPRDDLVAAVAGDENDRQVG